MLPNRKVYMGITGVAMIALGILCIMRPGMTVRSLAWLVGFIVLVSGFSTLMNWSAIRIFFPQSGSIFLSGILQVMLGFILLSNKVALASFVPVVFAFWLMIEGINLAIRSTDYKRYGFKIWWLLCGLGIAAGLLGFACLLNPVEAGGTLGTLLGIGIIMIGVIYLVALRGVNRFSKKIDRTVDWLDNSVDEQ